MSTEEQSANTHNKVLDPEYKAALSLLAEKNSDFIFHNKNEDHAALVIEQIVRTAKDEIRIFEELLCGDLMDKNDDLLRALKDKLSSGKRVRIVIKNGHINSSSSGVNELKKIAEKYTSLLEVKRASNDFIDSIKKINGGLVYVAVGDESSFRLEDASKPREAICSFNYPSVATVIKKYFDEKYGTCSSYF
ncbi:MAG: hypothetical protein KF905_04590 [Flavobacteriales bacterium]|nr:hypothetical protein [Flavobacteriales bacterium]